jgi:trk system potassium uptake protein TrkH
MANASVRRDGLRLLAGFRLAWLRADPSRLLLFGYVSYMLAGWSLPAAQAQPLAAIDALFIAASAVSTSGLVTVDPGASFTPVGEALLLLLFQAGGVGYMTLSSVAVLAIERRLSPARSRVLEASFSVPSDTRPGAFVVGVVVYTLLCEAAGALALWPMFAAAGVENPLWSAVFHAVSAFCTAGFSLNATGLEAFRDHAGVNIVISALSLAGGLGFLVALDLWRNLTGSRRALAFTTRVILRVTAAFLIGGTVLLMVVEPSFAALEAQDRLKAAFFQTMSATTTVGFNTTPIGALSDASVLLLLALMLFGASPSGTGGGLKSTSFAALVGLVRATLRRRDEITFAGRAIAPERVRIAAASLAYTLGLLLVASFLLALAQPDMPLKALLFEAVSAAGTVGLSLGVTGALGEIGKLIVIVLMIAGRVGVLSFGMAFVGRETRAEDARDADLAL